LNWKTGARVPLHSEGLRPRASSLVIKQEAPIDIKDPRGKVQCISYALILSPLFLFLKEE